ncbi:COesterase domain containing protein, partial [Asbolus verrucosus]
PPVPVQKWSGVYNATVDGPLCPQPNTDPISEDCLMLNVYTTKLPESCDNPKRPVIIYLHPGGFYSGSGRSNWGGPQYFLDQDIVLVTINYRIGSLGFISVGKEAPGNNALRDQVVAMKWVKNNIAAFGGDPD